MNRTDVRYNGVAGRCVNSPGRGHPRLDGGNVTDDTRAEMSERIRDALDSLPTGGRGPKPRRLRESLVHDLPLDVCWPWTGRRATNGYGIAVRPMQRDVGTSAHRLVWEILNGPVPDTWHVDHLCHDAVDCDPGVCDHRACVNPTHLKAVPAAVNVLRGAGPSALNSVKIECKRGHPFDDENTYVRAGKRACRECHRMHDRKRAANG